MPLRRAVVMSQAPGLSGIPSRGQCSSAATSASCTSSSARSQSPSDRTSAAVRRPCSSLYTLATSSPSATALPGALRLRSGKALSRLMLDERPDLDRAERRPGLRHRDRLVEVLDVDERVPADGLLRLAERAVGHGDLPVALADGGRGIRGLELLAAGDLAARGVLFEPLPDARVGRLDLGRARVPARIVADEHEHVLHCGPSVVRSVARSSAIRRAASPLFDMPPKNSDPGPCGPGSLRHCGVSAL